MVNGNFSELNQTNLYREKQFYDKSGFFFQAELQSVNGTQTCYLKPKNQDKGLVIFVHGAGNDLFFPNRLMFNHLLTKGYSIYAFDLNGHGATSKATLSHPALESTLNEVFDHAYSLAKSQPIHIVAHSFGGLACLTLLSKRNWQRVRSACFIGVPTNFCGFKWTYIWELACILRPNFWRHLFSYGFWHGLPACGPFKRNSFPIRIADISQANYVSYFARLWKELLALPLTACEHQNILFIYGGRDHLAPISESMLFNEKGLKMSIEYIPKETHLTLLLADKTFTRIDEWLSQHHL